MKVERTNEKKTRDRENRRERKKEKKRKESESERRVKQMGKENVLQLRKEKGRVKNN